MTHQESCWNSRWHISEPFRHVERCVTPDCHCIDCVQRTLKQAWEDQRANAKVLAGRWVMRAVIIDKRSFGLACSYSGDKRRRDLVMWWPVCVTSGNNTWVRCGATITGLPFDKIRVFPFSWLGFQPFLPLECSELFPKHLIHRLIILLHRNLWMGYCANVKQVLGPPFDKMSQPVTAWQARRNFSVAAAKKPLF